MRASRLLYQINDDWNALLTQSLPEHGRRRACSGRSSTTAAATPLPDRCRCSCINPSYDKDKFENTALTVNGRIGALKLVYAGGLPRSARTNQVQDYTNYSRGTYAGYYQCNYPGYPFVEWQGADGGIGRATATRRASSGRTTRRNTHQSHELRLSTPDDWRLRAPRRAVLGELHDPRADRLVLRHQPEFRAHRPPPRRRSTANNPSAAPARATCSSTTSRAATSRRRPSPRSTSTCIPKTLTLTVGTRYYDIENFESGSNVGSFGCEIYGPVRRQRAAAVPACIPAIERHQSERLGTSRQDLRRLQEPRQPELARHRRRPALLHLVAGLPAGRIQSRASPSSRRPRRSTGLFTPPLAYGPDTLTNNEIGWKTEWFDHRLQFNGAVYQEDWNERAARHLRSGRDRQSDVHHQRSQLPGARGPRPHSSRASTRGLTRHRRRQRGTAAKW